MFRIKLILFVLCASVTFFNDLSYQTSKRMRRLFLSLKLSCKRLVDRFEELK